MRLCTSALVFSLFAFSACSQTVTLVSVSPSEVKAYNRENANDNGVRTLDVKLKLSGKGRDVSFPLAIGAGSIASKPKLIDSVIHVNGRTFPKKRSKEVSYKVNLRLAPLSCLQQDEEFEIYNKVGMKPIKTQRITISHFTTVSDTPTISLKEDSTIITPYADGELAEGSRAIILSVLLSGKGSADVPLQFRIPPYVHLSSFAEINNSINFTIPKAAFSKDGCPAIIQIPMVINLKKDGNSIEEKFPILLKEDEKHAHIVVIRPAVKQVDKVDTSDTKKGISFSYACINRTFDITLRADNVGGRVEVFEDKTQKKYVYYYNNFFHSGDFAQWFFNVFGFGINQSRCNDCAACVSYIGERLNEELSASKKTPADVKSITEDKSGPVSKNDSTKADTIKKKDTTTNTQSKVIVPDTILFKSSMSYADTSLYNLEINRFKTKTDIKLCKDPKKGKDSCNSFSIAGDLTNESFNRIIPQLLQKFRGDELVNLSKISPSLAEIFSSYTSTLEEKNPKEKTEAQKHMEEILKNDTLTQTRVGIIHLKDSLIPIYDTNFMFIKKTKVDSVMFTIESGKIVRGHLFIETKDGTFINKSAPISVLRLNDRGNDVLVNEELGAGTLVYLKDVLKYRSYGPYIPDDIENAVVSPQQPGKVISAASNLNSLINFSIFTDLPGLLGRKANGLINTDITGKFVTNTGNFSNKDLTPVAFIEANLLLSKFDSKFKSLDSSDIKANSVNHLDTVDRMQLIQTAWLKGAVKFNLFSLRLMSSQYFQLNTGFRINVVNADSFYRKEADVIFFEYYPELLYSVKRLSNFGMDISLRWILQYLSGKEQFANKGMNYIFNPHVAFYYYPINNSNNTIYLRFNYFAGHEKYSNNFYQLQFGYKTSLKLSN